jgi:hypothetical protein
MLEPELDLQDVIWRRLKADPSITIPVFDQAPSQQKLPYIEFGMPTTSEDDDECITGLLVTWRVNIYTNDKGLAKLQTYMGAVRRSLDKFNGQMTDHALHSIRFVSSQITEQPNGIDYQGQVEFECRIEQV